MRHHNRNCRHNRTGNRLVLGLLWASVAALLTGLGATAGAANGAATGAATAAQTRAYAPDARTIVEVEGDKNLGWTITRYDRSQTRIVNEAVALRSCNRLKRMPERVRCSARVSQRNRDLLWMQQGLAYAHALAEN